MANRRCNALDPRINIGGSDNHSDTLASLTDESSQLGAALFGQTGSGATITAAASTATVTGLTGFAAASVGNFLQIENAANAANNGIWLIIEVTGATTAVIDLAGGISEGPGTFTWTERQPYSLEDDLNYIRTDRAEIKGVGYDQLVPSYVTCDGTVQPANLANIAGKTTDAKLIVSSTKFENASVSVGDGYITITSVSNLPYSDGYVGVPVYDGADAGNDESTYVAVLDGYGSSLKVLTGSHVGDRIFGRTRGGTTGSSPDSVEIEFRSVPSGYPVSLSSAYIWETGQPVIVDLVYPYRSCLDDMDENALRFSSINGTDGGGGNIAAQSIGQVLFSLDGQTFQPAIPITSNQGWLVNDQGILIIGA